MDRDIKTVKLIKNLVGEMFDYGAGKKGRGSNSLHKVGKKLPGTVSRIRPNRARIRGREQINVAKKVIRQPE